MNACKHLWIKVIGMYNDYFKNKMVQELISMDREEKKKELGIMIDVLTAFSSDKNSVYSAGSDIMPDEYEDAICMVFDGDDIKDVYTLSNDNRQWYILKNSKKIAISDIVDRYVDTAEELEEDERIPEDNRDNILMFAGYR